MTPPHECFTVKPSCLMPDRPKKPSLADIAREAGLSRNGVSLALRHDPSIPEATQQRVEAIARRLGYARNPLVGEVMARNRAGDTASYRGTFALFNANSDPQAFQRHPTIPLYVQGAERRAAEWGYQLDPFWLHDPEVNGHRLLRILRSRGIRGVLIIGLMKQNRLPEHFRAILEEFPCVVTGVRTREPALSFACVDHHILALRAVEKAVDLGYHRPGLVLDQVIDDLVEHRFSAGYRVGQQALPPADRLEPLFDVTDTEAGFQGFGAWLEREQPDVLLILYNNARDWLARLNLRVPEDIGLIQLEWRASRPRIAGMNQHNDLTGEAAVEMLAGLVHRGQRGIPEFPRATLIGPSWIDGASVKCPRTS